MFDKSKNPSKMAKIIVYYYYKEYFSLSNLSVLEAIALRKTRENTSKYLKKIIPLFKNLKIQFFTD